MENQPAAEVKADALLARIREAFAAVPPPAAGNLAPHSCDECDQLSRSLLGRAPDDLPEEWVRRNFDQLPLLSDEAKHYFLPAYLRTALREEHAVVAEFLLYTLESDHRWEPVGGYSPGQRAVIFEYLTLGAPDAAEVAEDWSDPFAENYARALARWRPAP